MIKDSEHITNLSSKLGAKIFHDVSCNENKNPYVEHKPSKEPEIHLCDDGNAETDYWISLHELGHVADDPPRRFPWERDKIAEDEARAWLWALKNSNRILDEIGKDVIAINFSTYLYGYTSEYLEDLESSRHLARLVGQADFKSDGFKEFTSRSDFITTELAMYTWRQFLEDISKHF